MNEKSINKKLEDRLIGELEILPLRTLDDFLLNSATFQIPDFKDTKRWWNRVFNNLYYYQTNYILLSAAIFLLFGFMYGPKLFYGLMITVHTWFILKNFTVPKLIGFCVSAILYLFFDVSITYALTSLIIFWFSIFTILFATLLHASMRLRSLHNKFVNSLSGANGEQRRTPMTVLVFRFVDSLGDFAVLIKKITSNKNKVSFEKS